MRKIYLKFELQIFIPANESFMTKAEIKNPFKCNLIIAYFCNIVLETFSFDCL